jgi:uncharacterized membrane protein YqjE
MIEDSSQSSTHASPQPSTHPVSAPADHGLGATTRELIQHIIGLISARLSLAALELSEARDAALLIIALALGAFIAGSFTLIALSALIVVLTWDALGWRIVLLLTLAYAGIAGILIYQIRRIIRAGRLGLPATLAELKQDSETLLRQPRSGGHT